MALDFWYLMVYIPASGISTIFLKKIVGSMHNALGIKTKTPKVISLRTKRCNKKSLVSSFVVSFEKMQKSTILLNH